MKVPKKILKLIYDRSICADKLNALDSEIRKWLKDKDIDTNELYGEYGCMITTEPCGFAEMTIKLIESVESND